MGDGFNGHGHRGRKGSWGWEEVGGAGGVDSELSEVVVGMEVYGKR